MLFRSWDIAVGMFRELAGHAARAGVTIVIEHLNEHDVPGALVSTPKAAAGLVEAVGSDHVRLLYDAYHAAMAGIDPVRDVGAYVGLISHVQYADSPGRGAPGTGTIDFTASFRNALVLRLPWRVVLPRRHWCSVTGGLRCSWRFVLRCQGLSRFLWDPWRSSHRQPLSPFLGDSGSAGGRSPPIKWRPCMYNGRRQSFNTTSLEGCRR